jgi:nitrogen fixation-related uncharacterized protein
MTSAKRLQAGRRLNATTLVLAVCILIPACYGFGRKFLELVALVGDEEGTFAVMPVVNYLLATLGFGMLFLWAMLHGMFRDIEAPKRTMLENEAQLDAEAEDERETWKGD